MKNFIKDFRVFLVIAHHAFLLQGARKALGPRWSTPASLPNMMFGGGGGDQSMLNPETPSKSLLGTDTSSSMLFSPPSILKVLSYTCTLYCCQDLIKYYPDGDGVNDWLWGIDEGVNDFGGKILYHGRG